MTTNSGQEHAGEGVAELVKRLRFLHSLNQPTAGGPYQGHAAEQCMKAMHEAAAALEKLTRERDEARDDHRRASELLTAAIEDHHDALARIAALEAENAKTLKKAAEAAYRVCAETRHVSLGDKVRDAILGEQP